MLIPRKAHTMTRLSPFPPALLSSLPLSSLFNDPVSKSFRQLSMQLYALLPLAVAQLASLSRREPSMA